MKSQPTSSITSTPLRRRAETRLRERLAKHQPGAGVSRSTADTHRLLHELQVHQIELEMQNEELRKTRDEMEAGMERFSDLYDFAPVGYFTFSPEGTIRQVNLTGAKLVGIERSRLVGQSFDRMVTAELRPAFHSFLKLVFAGETKETREFSLWGQGQPPRFVGIEARRSSDQGECRAVVTDITEHKRAEDLVRVSEIRYRRLFETAHDGLLLLDPRTRKITNANPFMTKLLGYPHDQLVGKELFEIGLLKDETASQGMFLKLTKSHQVRYEDLPLESKAGRHQEVEVVANLYMENGHSVIQCNIRDITARKLAETALQASEERYRTLFTSIDEGYCVIEMIFDRRRKPVDYRFLEVNPAFQKQTGLVRPLGKRMRELVPAIENHWIEFYGKVVLTGKAVRFVNEAKAMEGRWFDVYACPVGGPGSGKVAIIFNDITARRKADDALRTARVQLTQHASMLEKKVTARTMELIATNQQLSLSLDSTRLGEEQNRVLLLESQAMHKKLRQLTHQILTAQEEERKKISRELHDEVVQTLVGINVELSALVHANSAGVRQLKDKIAHTQRLVEGSVDAVHRFARELRPAVLDDLGLIPALHAYCKSLAARKKLKIQMTAFRGVEHLDSDRRTVLFRVAQEALTNVARHARATRVRLTISKLPGAVRLEISDNGKAFPVRTILRTKTKRLGLVGMRERVEMVGGNLTIDSVSGKGTTVRAEISFIPEKTNQ